MKICSVEGCWKPFNSKNLCLMHYTRMRRHGNLNSKYGSFPERFWNKVEKTATCWLWSGSKRTGGYGCFRLNNQMNAAHRVSYELTKGGIPVGMLLDHLCRNPPCVNPDHLEPVSHRENCLRGVRGRMTTHCPKGHEYSKENTYINKSGHRFCRTCRNASVTKWAKLNKDKVREYNLRHKLKKGASVDPNS